MSTARKIGLGIVAFLVVVCGVGYFVWVRPFLALANVHAEAEACRRRFIIDCAQHFHTIA